MAEEIRKEHPEVIKQLEELRIAIRSKKAPEPSEEAITELRKKLEKARTERNGGNCNGLHRIVTEVELLSLLDQGWEIVKELTNGHIVVRRKA